MTNIYFDTEFTGLHQHTTLISIGCVSQGGAEIYCEFTDYNKDQVNDWIEKNVIANLTLEPPGKSNVSVGGPYSWFCGNTAYIRTELDKWLSQFENVQMVSDCLAYDWVLFCQIWGHAFSVPANISPAPRDINQELADFLEISERAAFNINREEFAEIDGGSQKHNALWDARVIRACYEKISR